jgi:uncharacterized protein with von Willebrand factor type A (vWA) domain
VHTLFFAQDHLSAHVTTVREAEHLTKGRVKSMTASHNGGHYWNYGIGPFILFNTLKEFKTQY